MSLKKTNPFSELYRKYPNFSLLIGLFLLTLILFSFMVPGKFFTLSNFSSIAFQLPELGILTIAMAITMLSGGINLSIIATANLSGIVMASIMKAMIQGQGSPVGLIITLAVLAGFGCSLLVGLANGIIIAFIGVSPILATLGTMTLVNGISILSTKGYVISGLPDGMLFIGNGSILGIPVPFVIFAVVALLVGFWLKNMPSGLSNYLIGSNETATRYSGVNTKAVIMKTHILSGLLSGVAAMIMISRFNSARAGYAESYLLVTVLASVFGGVDPSGGFGKVGGVVLSLFILQMVSSGLNLLGVSSFISVTLWGVLLIGIMIVQKYQRK
ncbi:MAG TPA: ABC transporter permease [Thermotogota bacterium]|nr:ABC transporter permease [Thermotogota bacterium]HPJ88297.1 ABC transporter permease [Thermotogota bacterium]HPR95356.1 ABC transporter permease [Thermotogota bacterium]